MIGPSLQLSISKIKIPLNNIQKRKCLSKSSKLKAIINMITMNQNTVRTRRPNGLIQNWVTIKRNSHSLRNTSNFGPINHIDNENYRNDYDNLHVPIRTIKFADSYENNKNETNNLKNEENPGTNKKLEDVKNYFFDFCQGTSLHGLRYVGMPNTSLFEKFFWMTAFMGAMGFAAYFISNIYDKWVYTPVIVGINPTFQSISNIPFPAVTICNMNQARKTEAEKILAGDNEAEKFLLDDICNFNFSDLAPTFSENVSSKIRNWDFIKAFILKVSQPCSDMLIYCKWQGFEIPCKSILNSALTDEGVCCTFNRVASHYMYRGQFAVGNFNISFPPDNIDWTPENGYPASATNYTWPYRAAGAGEHIGLTVITNISAEQYYCSSTNSVGLKVRLHSPVESPMISDYGFLIHPRKEIRIAIRPTMDEASSSIYKIPIKNRQCYFSVERELLFYRTYTKLNCELECLSNYTANQCGCVPFYLPKNENITICDKSAEACFRKAKTDMDISELPTLVCDCLPACNEIQYGQDHSMGDISRADLRRGLATTIEPANLAILHFFYQTGQFRSYEKSELFGFTEFLSNSGGLLGLFLGFSFLSAVEIIYFLTLRLWCVSYRRHNEQKLKTATVYPFIQ